MQPSLPLLQPPPPPPTRVATPMVPVPMPPPAMPLTVAAPLQLPLLVTWVPALSPPTTANVVHRAAEPGEVAEPDVDAALVRPLHHLAVGPSETCALSVVFPQISRLSAASVASQIVAIWESGPSPMRDWSDGSWTKLREGYKKFDSSQVTERAQQYFAVRVGTPSLSTPESCTLNATELKKLGASLKDKEDKSWNWFRKASYLAKTRL